MRKNLFLTICIIGILMVLVVLAFSLGCAPGHIMNVVGLCG